MPDPRPIAPGSRFRASACGLTLALFGSACSENRIAALTPDISVSPPELAFGDAAVNVDSTQELAIDNLGGAALVLRSVRFEPKLPEFTLVLPDVPDDEVLEVAPHSTLVVPVTFHPETELPFDTEIVIRSNDVETPEVRVPTSGVGIYVPQPDIEVCGFVLDFGEVAPGATSSTLTCSIGNSGTADLSIASVTIEGDATFSLLADPSGQKIAAEGSYPLIVQYDPTGADGDQAVLHIASDDPDENPVDIILVGNGGDGFEPPVAVIDCPASAAPPEYVTLDGSASFDPLGSGIKSYLWQIAQRPDDSQASLTASGGSVTSLFADSAGDYEVSLSVQSGAGVWSDPAFCSFPAIPADAIHVELTWDGLSSDIDLHLREDGAAIFDTPEDACYCNPFPEWGAGGTDDNPRLDLDDQAGKGPENINILAPADGTYHVAVHYFDDDYDGLVTATVRVYLFGQLVDEELHTMNLHDLWEVGTIEWPAATFTPDGAVYTQKATGCQ